MYFQRQLFTNYADDIGEHTLSIQFIVLINQAQNLMMSVF